jgi:hypothetical protein
MEVGTIYPLLLYLFQTRKDDISSENLQGIVIDLESFLVRRMVCGLPTKNYNNLFLCWLASLKAMTQIDRQNVRSVLLQSDAETARWPDDSELERAWMSVMFTWSRHRAKIVLKPLITAHHFQARTVHLTGALTLEHLMPQAWQPKIIRCLTHPMKPANSPE